mmetsp:Transcript_20366/g.51919  ORF Transcript_20366/g.51919 Transcript_20366/m.51919 type:complete len:221 (-) Transcript_20366:32-694(-)
MPVPRVALFVMPSVCVGSTPLCSIISITAIGSSPVGGKRSCELCDAEIQYAATCSGVAPSWCVHNTSAPRLSSSKQTLALPAASAVFSGGVFIRGSLDSMSARKESRVRTTSGVLCQQAVWITAPCVIESMALGLALPSNNARRDFGHGGVSRVPTAARTRASGMEEPIRRKSLVSASSSSPRRSLAYSDFSFVLASSCAMVLRSVPMERTRGRARGPRG